MQYRLERGAQQTLAAVIPQLADLIPEWQDQIKSGEIDEQLRQVSVALGWITPRDHRVKPVGRQSTGAPTVRPARTSPLRASAVVPESTGETSG